MDGLVEYHKTMMDKVVNSPLVTEEVREYKTFHLWLAKKFIRVWEIMNMEELLTETEKTRFMLWNALDNNYEETISLLSKCEYGSQGSYGGMKVLLHRTRVKIVKKYYELYGNN